MSLLLEALKKAELAKQAAKETAPSTDAPPFTRDKLPDISQPMEIHSEDLGIVKSEPAPGRAEKPALELALEQPRPAPVMPEPPPAARAAPVEAAYTPPVETTYTPPSESVERMQAQQLFESKELDINPRKPFYYTVAALGVFALGTIGYFWYQLQPRSAFRAPPPSTAPPPVAQAAPPAAAAPAAATVTPPAEVKPAEAPPAKPAAAEPAAARVPAAARGPVFARQASVPTQAAAAPGPAPSNILITPANLQPDPVLEGAFDAFNAGDLERSRSGYQQALQARPDNRDALLGLAAVELRLAHHDAAEGYYRRLLELDPRDAQAQAAVIGLRGQIDPVAAESRLKTMIAAQPEATYLYFTLGNQYAAQQRWTEAQQAFFKAYSGDPEHPDFAYNLAISLDQLHQKTPALEYYRRALALAQNRPVSFDRAQVNKRVSQLER